ncbi:MAG TPA: class I SAM-dependent methyltransferase [Solirubrobacterales bacterium]
MSATPQNATREAQSAADPPRVLFDARAEFASRFLSGRGLEIGALHQPLALPPHAHVRYVDRMSAESLHAEYPELADWDLTSVDAIDDGERLTTIPDASQDFIVANHFLEHCEDPIATIGTHLSKLKPGGILFYAVPDKRYTFDFRRPLTPLDHMIGDHEGGAEESRREHYEEWSRLVTEESDWKPDDPEAEERAIAVARRLEADRYSIHMHVWTQAEFLQLILHCRARFGDAFDIEAAARRSLEFVVVLRKQGPIPEIPNAPTAPPEPRRPLRAIPRRAVAALRRARHRRAAQR